MTSSFVQNINYIDEKSFIIIIIIIKYANILIYCGHIFYILYLQNHILYSSYHMLFCI